MTSLANRISVWVFGEEGDVLLEPSILSLIVASSILVTGNLLLSPLIADLAVVFDVTEAQSGWFVVAFTAAAAISLPIGGVFSDLIGRKPIVVGGLLLFGIAGAAIGFVTTFYAALAFRAVLGVGFALSTLTILSLFGDLFSGSRETTVQAARVSLNSVANLIAPLLAGVLFLYSWRYPFFLYLLAIPVALTIWLTVPSIESTADLAAEKYLKKVFALLQQPPTVLLNISFFARFVIFYGVLTYISVLAIQEAGLAVIAIGTILSVRGFIKIISSTQAGRLSVVFDTAIIALVGFVFLAGGIFLMGAVPTSAMLFFGAALWGVGDGILSPAQKSLVNQLSTNETRSGAMSVALTFQNVGKVVGPLLLGVLIGIVGPAYGFVILGAFGGLCGIVALLGVVLLR